MLEENQEEYQVPSQPALRPIENLDIEDFSLEIDLEPMTLDRDDVSRSDEELKMEDQLTVYDCWERQDPEDCDNLPPLKRRHIETREFGSNIRRSMLSKLDQMERAPTKRRHH